MLLFLLLGFLQIAGISGIEPSVQQSKQQAKHYISNISQNKNVDENLWALTLLTSAHPEVRRFVEKKIKEEEKSTNALSEFAQIDPTFSGQLKKVVFLNGSPGLFTALLLETKSKKERKNLYNRYRSKFPPDSTADVNYAALFQKIISGNKVGTNELTAKSYHLPHFFILFEYSDSVTDDWLTGITQNWRSKTESSQDLYKTLSQYQSSSCSISEK
ncbi:MAG: hypothetical protein U5J63_15670 [Fodinibius sp.]|nr:hypothetical protein [Fodinibius sp.]